MHRVPGGLQAPHRRFGMADNIIGQRTRPQLVTGLDSRMQEVHGLVEAPTNFLRVLVSIVDLAPLRVSHRFLPHSDGTYVR